MNKIQNAIKAARHFKPAVQATKTLQLEPGATYQVDDYARYVTTCNYAAMLDIQTKIENFQIKTQSDLTDQITQRLPMKSLCPGDLIVYVDSYLTKVSGYIIDALRTTINDDQIRHFAFHRNMDSKLTLQSALINFHCFCTPDNMLAFIGNQSFRWLKKF